jgi:DNA-binding transcriptional regulator YiaG
MKTKIQKEYVDRGFGFPLYFQNVPMVYVRGIWTPKVNYKKLSEMVLQMLVEKPSRLTGNELKFIRNKLQMTLKAFAERFYVTHPAVMKWEKSADHSTNMNWVTEKDIRLHVYQCVSKEENLSVIYELLQKPPSPTSRKTKIDFEKMAILV